MKNTKQTKLKILSMLLINTLYMSQNTLYMSQNTLYMSQFQKKQILKKKQQKIILVEQKDTNVTKPLKIKQDILKEKILKLKIPPLFEKTLNCSDSYMPIKINTLYMSQFQKKQILKKTQQKIILVEQKNIEVKNILNKENLIQTNFNKKIIDTQNEKNSKQQTSVKNKKKEIKTIFDLKVTPVPSLFDEMPNYNNNEILENFNKN